MFPSQHHSHGDTGRVGDRAVGLLFGGMRPSRNRRGGYRIGGLRSLSMLVGPIRVDDSRRKGRRLRRVGLAALCNIYFYQYSLSCMWFPWSVPFLAVVGSGPFALIIGGMNGWRILDVQYHYYDRLTTMTRTPQVQEHSCCLHINVVHNTPQ